MSLVERVANRLAPISRYRDFQYNLLASPRAAKPRGLRGFIDRCIPRVFAAWLTEDAELLLYITDGRVLRFYVLTDAGSKSFVGVLRQLRQPNVADTDVLMGRWLRPTWLRAALLAKHGGEA